MTIESTQKEKDYSEHSEAAVIWMKMAWDSINPTIITKSFKSALSAMI